MKSLLSILLISLITILSSCEDNFAYNAGHIVGKSFLYFALGFLILYILFKLFNKKKK